MLSNSNNVNLCGIYAIEWSDQTQFYEKSGKSIHTCCAGEKHVIPLLGVNGESVMSKKLARLTTEQVWRSCNGEATTRGQGELLSISNIRYIIYIYIICIY